MRRLASALVALLLSTSAYAACPKPYSGADLGADLGVLATSLRDQDMEKFLPVGKRVEDGLSCADKAFPKMAYAAVYRYIGISHFRSGDTAGATRWFTTALELEPTFSFDVDELDFADPMRAAFELARDNASVDPVPMRNVTLATDPSSSWLLDGRPLTSPQATLDRPHLLQKVNSADQSVLAVYLIDGNGFPPDAIKSTTPVATAEEPKKKGKDKKPTSTPVATTTGTDDAYQVVKIDRVRPPAKTPLILVGGLSVVGGGVLYGLSFASHGQFDAATDTESLLAAQRKTNLLVVASGAVFAVGVGAGYVGITLDTGPGWVVGAKF